MRKIFLLWKLLANSFQQNNLPCLITRFIGMDYWAFYTWSSKSRHRCTATWQAKKAGGSPRESDENNQQGNKHDKRDIAQTVKGSDLLFIEKIHQRGKQEHKHILICRCTGGKGWTVFPVTGCVVVDPQAKRQAGYLGQTGRKPCIDGKKSERKVSDDHFQNKDQILQRISMGRDVLFLTPHKHIEEIPTKVSERISAAEGGTRQIMTLSTKSGTGG